MCNVYGRGPGWVCTLLMYDFRFLFRWELYSQHSHMNGLSSECVSKWFFRFPLVAKRWSQVGHWWWSNPVWVCLWFAKVVWTFLLYIHICHIQMVVNLSEYTEYGFIILLLKRHCNHSHYIWTVFVEQNDFFQCAFLGFHLEQLCSHTYRSHTWGFYQCEYDNEVSTEV